MNFTLEYLPAALIAFVPALVNLGMAIHAFFILPKKEINRIFSLFTFNIFIWQMGDTMMRLSGNETDSEYWLLLLQSNIPIIVALGLHFSLLFANKLKNKITSWKLVLIYFPAGILMAFLFTGASEVTFINDSFWGSHPKIVPTSFNAVFGFWISAMAALILWVLLSFVFRSLKDKRSVEFKQSVLIAIGLSIPCTQGVVTEIVYPLLLDLDPVPITTCSIVAFSTATFISQVKYKFLVFSQSYVSNDILNNMNEAIIIADTEGKIQFFNENLLKISGYVYTEIIGKPIDMLIVHNEASGSEKEIQIRKKDGTISWLEITTTPYMQDNEVVGTVWICNNIDRQKLTESQLMTIEEKFQKLFDLTNDAIILRDEKGNILEVNAKTCSLLGYAREELTEKKIFHLLSPASIALLKKSIKSLNESQHYDNLELELVSKHGEIIPIELSASVFELGGEKVVLGVLRDITKRKQNERQLQFSDTIIKNINNYVLATDQNGEIIYASQSVTDKLGYSKEEILGNGWYTISKKNNHLNFRGSKEYIQKKTAGARQSFPSYEDWVLDKNGKKRHILWQDAKGPDNLLIRIGTDITIRKELEKKMMLAINESQEKERKRIATDLHDGIGQILAATNMNLMALNNNDSVNPEYLNKAFNLIDRAISDVRTISHGLMPPRLQENGLIKSIYNIISEFEEIEIEFTYDFLILSYLNLPRSICIGLSKNVS